MLILVIWLCFQSHTVLLWSLPVTPANTCWCVCFPQRGKRLSHLISLLCTKKVIQTRLLCLLGYRIQRHLKECTDIKLCIYLKRHVTGNNLPYVTMISSGSETERDCIKHCMFVYIKKWEIRSSFLLKYSPHN